MGQQLLGQRPGPVCRPFYSCDPDRVDGSYIEAIRIEEDAEYHQRKFPLSGVSIERKFREELPRRPIDGGNYIGQWSEQKRDGHGTQYYLSGATYKGEWVKDHRHGMGCFDHHNGDKYVGEFEQNAAHGEGTHYSTDGSRYIGQWAHNKQHGKGKEEWANGTMFEGQYQDGAKTGDGCYIWPIGSRFEGQIVSNQFAGTGTWITSKGRKYVGQWSANKFNGQGRFTWEDSKTYDGEYKDDKKHGEGIFTFADGRQFEGQWRRGKMHGNGCWRIPSKGKERMGIWKSGRFTGWVDGGDDNSDEIRDMEQSLSLVSASGRHSLERANSDQDWHARGGNSTSTGSPSKVSKEKVSFNDIEEALALSSIASSSIGADDDMNVPAPYVSGGLAFDDYRVCDPAASSVVGGFAPISPSGGYATVPMSPSSVSPTRDPTYSMSFNYPTYASEDRDIPSGMSGIITARSRPGSDTSEDDSRKTPSSSFNTGPNFGTSTNGLTDPRKGSNFGTSTNGVRSETTTSGKFNYPVYTSAESRGRLGTSGVIRIASSSD